MAAGHELYRETGDVDLGIPPIVARDHHVVGRLKDLDYTQVAGNRFARGLSDIPVKMKGKDDSPRPEAFIDVLVPAYTSRARENVQVGEDLFTTEVPGLQLALARAPVTITLELRRLNGAILECELPFPDEVSAVVLKSLATTVRSKDTDISDIWRCLEIAFAAGLGPADFTRGVRAESAEVIRSLFSSRRGAPAAALAAEQRLSAEATDARYPDTGADRTCPRADVTPLSAALRSKARNTRRPRLPSGCRLRIQPEAQRPRVPQSARLT